MYRHIRYFFLILAFTASSAFAIGDNFDQARFDRLIEAGQPVLIAIHADWCSTCRAQENVLKELLKAFPYNKLQVLRVDFDKQQNVVHAFKTRWQSTLIVFKNGKEIDRSTGDTNKNSIARMLREAL